MLKVYNKKQHITMLYYEINLLLLYRASRPMLPIDGRYPVTVVDMETGDDVYCLHDLTLAEASDFINGFNNGRISLAGRVW